MTSDVAERAQDVRDLRNQIDGLQRNDQAEMIFRDTSPRRPRVKVYSMVDGEEITILRYQLEKTLEKRLPDGRYMFTARRHEAPTFKRGSVKCFLHAESPERPILNEIGLAGITCPAASLANLYSKRIHGQHRHKQEWAAYQDYLMEQRETGDRERQQQQLEATLALAGRVSAQATVAPSEPAVRVKRSVRCPICGEEFSTGFEVGRHKKEAHAEGSG